MTLQNTDSHTKNMRAAHCGERWAIIALKTGLS